MNIGEIKNEIKRLENENTTYENCSKLAMLYSIVDHLGQDKPKVSASYGSTEFMLAISQAPIDEALNVIDEHMNSIALLYPTEYRAIIKKIKQL